jgi:hypothetical protein
MRLIASQVFLFLAVATTGVTAWRPGTSTCVSTAVVDDRPDPLSHRVQHRERPLRRPLLRRHGQLPAHHTFRKVQTFSFGNLDRFRTGDLLVRLTADVNNVKSAVLFGVMNLLQAPFTILMVLIIGAVPGSAPAAPAGGVMVVVSVVLFSLLRNIQKLFMTARKRWTWSTTACKKTCPACAWSRRSCARKL